MADQVVMRTSFMRGSSELLFGICQHFFAVRMTKQYLH
jgi:hypothetical protein